MTGADIAALTLMREIMAQDIPPVFEGTVEVNTLSPLLRKKVAKGTAVCSDTFRSYLCISQNTYGAIIIEDKILVLKLPSFYPSYEFDTTLVARIRFSPK